MKRKREQAGQMFQRHGSWFVRFYESRVIDGEVKRLRVCKQLAEEDEGKIHQRRLQSRPSNWFRP